MSIIGSNQSKAGNVDSATQKVFVNAIFQRGMEKDVVKRIAPVIIEIKKLKA